MKLSTIDLAKEFLMSSLGGNSPLTPGKAFELAIAFENEVPKGFVEKPKGILHIYLDAAIGGWYLWDADNQVQIPIAHKAIEGVAKLVRLNIKEYKGNEVPKLELFLRCNDQDYCLRSGIDTVFSKTLMLALWEIQDYSRTIIISIEQGKENNFFARLHDSETKRRISYEWREIEPTEFLEELRAKITNIPTDDHPPDKKEVTPTPEVVEKQPTYKLAERKETIPQPQPEVAAKATAKTGKGKSPLTERDLLLLEVKSFSQRRGVTAEVGKSLIIERYGEESSSMLSIEQLKDLVNFFKGLKNQEPATENTVTEADLAA